DQFFDVSLATIRYSPPPSAYLPGLVSRSMSSGFSFPAIMFSDQNRPPNPRSQATVSALIGEDTAERRSTVLRRNALILLCVPNDGEQGRTLYWRKGWDSNPRCPCRHAGFQDRCLKPLGHPSAGSGFNHLGGSRSRTRHEQNGL